MGRHEGHGRVQEDGASQPLQGEGLEGWAAYPFQGGGRSRSFSSFDGELKKRAGVGA